MKIKERNPTKKENNPEIEKCSFNSKHTKRKDIKDEGEGERGEKMHAFSPKKK